MSVIFDDAYCSSLSTALIDVITDHDIDVVQSCWVVEKVFLLLSFSSLTRLVNYVAG